MGPLSYMPSVVDRNVVMRRIPVVILSTYKRTRGGRNCRKRSHRPASWSSREVPTFRLVLEPRFLAIQHYLGVWSTAYRTRVVV